MQSYVNNTIWLSHSLCFIILLVLLLFFYLVVKLVSGSIWDLEKQQGGNWKLDFLKIEGTLFPYM